MNKFNNEFVINIIFPRLPNYPLSDADNFSTLYSRTLALILCTSLA